MEQDIARAAADAAIQAATISVWGAVTVGVLATIGTILAAVIAPFASRRAERREADRRERSAALRSIIPDLVLAGMQLGTAVDPSEKNRLLSETFAAAARLEMWAGPEEWQVGRVAQLGFAVVPRDGDLRAKSRIAAAQILPRWALGEISAEEVKSRFEKATGTVVGRWAPSGGDSWERSAPTVSDPPAAPEI